MAVGFFLLLRDLCDLCGERDLSQEMHRQEKESDSVAHRTREPRPVFSSVVCLGGLGSGFLLVIHSSIANEENKWIFLFVGMETCLC